LVETLECRCVPATITPTTFLDGGLGSGSLRDAVLQLNADTGTDDDIIQLEAGTYALTIPNVGGRHETAGFTGDLNLTQTSHRWIIQGAGPSTIIDAGQLQDRVFQIVNPGTQVEFRDLVIQGGLAQDDGTDGALAGFSDALGGGIFNNGGDLALANVVLQNNVALGGNGYNARGGGLYSTGGALTISAGTLANNHGLGGNGAGPGGSGGNAQGGGLYVGSGTVTVSNSTITANTVRGGDSGGLFVWGGATEGGGLYAHDGTVTISGSTVANNQAIGGNVHGTTGCLEPCNFGHGGASQGGGLYVGGGTLTVGDAMITGNTLQGGTGGPNGASQGGGLYADGDTVTVTNAMIAANTLQGRGSQGGGLYAHGGTVTVGDAMIAGNTLQSIQAGASQGGGLYVDGSTLTVHYSTIAFNTLQGGGGGAPAQGGGLYAHGGAQTISHSTLANNQATGGIGGTGFYDIIPGGPAQGGGLYAMGGLLTFADSTAAANTVRGGDGGTNPSGPGPDGGPGEGGGLWLAAGETAHVSFSTIANNQATGGTHGSGNPNGSNGPATGGGVYNQGTLQTYDTILAGNTVTGPGTNTSPDLAGNLGSLGHNLIGTTQGGSGFDPTDLLNVDPLLGPLQDNGGPTFTMALLEGSPAIDAGNNVYASMWDQRGPGFPRIIHGTIDIGAFEYRPAVQLNPNPVPISEPGPTTDTMQPGFPASQPTLDLAVEALAAAVPPRTQTAFSPVPFALHEFVRDSLFDVAGDPLLDGLAGY
jgi:hypothetical protein